MTPKIKITVATVCFNAGALIGRTLESVAAQTYEGVEHVIVDGASTDDTLALAEAYRAATEASGSGHEVRLLSERDNGLYDAMNKAIQLAAGTYIVFLNAGDKFHDASTLARIAAAAEAAAVGDVLPAVVYGDTNIVDADGRFLCRRRLSPPEQLTWRSFRSGMLVCHQAFFARTDLAKAHPYDLRFRFSADFDWCIRLMHAARNEAAQNANAHVVVADYLSEGLTTRNHRASLRERFRIMRRHYGLFSTVAMHAWFVVRAAIR